MYLHMIKGISSYVVVAKMICVRNSAVDDISPLIPCLKKHSLPIRGQHVLNIIVAKIGL